MSHFDTNKASLLKRFSAFLLDLVILIGLSALFISILSKITDYDFYSTQLIYDRAYEDLIADPESVESYRRLVQLTAFNLSFGVFLAFFLGEFIIPLIFGNGMTLGKRIFGLCLMRKGGWKVNWISLLVRAVLGKYIIETMVPLLVFMMILFGSSGMIGPVIITVLFILEIILLFTSPCHQAIHDLVADTVVVEKNQKIYCSEEDAIKAGIEYNQQEDDC